MLDRDAWASPETKIKYAQLRGAELERHKEELEDYF